MLLVCYYPYHSCLHTFWPYHPYLSLQFSYFLYLFNMELSTINVCSFTFALLGEIKINPASYVA